MLQTSRRLFFLQARSIHATQRQESGLIVGGLGVAAAAIATRYGVEALEAYRARPKSKSTNLFTARNFYDGPFEDVMTRREAALILGVRESASAERIRNAHRKLLILNPNTSK